MGVGNVEFWAGLLLGPKGRRRPLESAQTGKGSRLQVPEGNAAIAFSHGSG